MAKYTQVYNFVNAIASAMTGGSMGVQSTKDLNAFGDYVLGNSQGNQKELWFGTLVDQIYKTILSNKKYSADKLGVYVDATEYGTILQELYVNPLTATTNATWSALNDGDTPQLVYIVKGSCRQKFYGKQLDGFEVDVTIPDKQLKTAFKDASTMSTFINGIYMELDNAMELRLDALIREAICVWILNRVHYQANPELVSQTIPKQLCIDLRREYNTFYGYTKGDDGYVETKEEYERNPQCLLFTGMRMKEVLSDMGDFNSLWSAPDVKSNGAEEHYIRQTDESELNIIFEESFIRNYEMRLQSDVYHKELLNLPNAKTIRYWQAPGDGKYSCRRNIRMTYETLYTADGSKKEYTFGSTGLDGVVAIAYDTTGIFCTHTDRRLTSQYDPRHELTALYNKADMAYNINVNKNGVVFFIGSAQGTVATGSDNTSIPTPTVVS